MDITIDIILASFNGGKFIDAQITSIISQDYTNWRLLIHDDGSSDNTIQIIKYWMERDSRIFLIEDEIKFGHSGANFLHLLKYANAPYIMFCDQDDIWLPHKTGTLLECINHKDNSKPVVIFSNAYVWRPEDDFIGEKATLTYPRKIEDAVFLGGIQGAAAVFNQKMRDILLIDLRIPVMHDHYLTLAGIVLGEIDYLDKCLMLYRQHGNNITGRVDSSMIQKYKNFFFRRNVPVIYKRVYAAIEAFYMRFKDSIKNDDAKKIQNYLISIHKTLPQRLMIIIKNKFNIFNSTPKLLIKCLVRPYYR
jgi:rhamnosyltransferase